MMFSKLFSWLGAWSTLVTILHARVFQLLKFFRNFSTKLIHRRVFVWAFHEALWKLLATRNPSIKINLNFKQTNFALTRPDRIKAQKFTRFKLSRTQPHPLKHLTFQFAILFAAVRWHFMQMPNCGLIFKLVKMP